jgi:WS/DGAT C-terminal domain
VQTVTTNVPGPRDPLYVLGRRLTALYPYVPIGDAVRISVAILSYVDTVSFGVTADYDSSPDLDVFVGGIQRGLAELSKVNGLTACHRPDDEIRFRAAGYRVRQRRLRWFVGQILLAGEEPDERAALAVPVIADGRVPGFQRVEHRALGDLSGDSEFHLAVHVGQRPQVGGQDDPDHGSVCTSTESTAGRSRTIGSQLSPASAEA